MNFSQIFSRFDMLSKTGCKIFKVKEINLSFNMKSTFIM